MAQNRIEIITDSTCDIPQVLLDQYAITVLPHVVIWGEKQYRDRVDLLPEAFYRRLAVEKDLPTTSQASVPDFIAAYQQACDRGAKAVVAILLNGNFSGAIQSARQAVESARIPIHIYDSHAVTMGLGWQVLAAARAREIGGDAEDMLAAAEKVRQRVQLYICLDTLAYVYRGGRIGNAQRLVGTMLNIKPIIYVDHKTGTVEASGMALTRRKSLELLYQKFFEQMDGHKNMRIAVLHGDAAQDAAALYDRVKQEYHPAELLTNITCPILGIHTGPQAVALAGYAE